MLASPWPFRFIHNTPLSRHQLLNDAGELTLSLEFLVPSWKNKSKSHQTQHELLRHLRQCKTMQLKLKSTDIEHHEWHNPSKPLLGAILHNRKMWHPMFGPEPEPYPALSELLSSLDALTPQHPQNSHIQSNPSHCEIIPKMQHECNS